MCQSVVAVTCRCVRGSIRLRRNDRFSVGGDANLYAQFPLCVGSFVVGFCIAWSFRDVLSMVTNGGMKSHGERQRFASIACGVAQRFAINLTRNRAFREFYFLLY